MACLYFRLVAPRSVDVYKTLEPLYTDYRRLISRKTDADFATTSFTTLHMDEFIDKLLHKNRVFGINLPRILKRWELEEMEELEPYESKAKNIKIGIKRDRPDYEESVTEKND